MVHPENHTEQEIITTMPGGHQECTCKPWLHVTSSLTELAHQATTTDTPIICAKKLKKHDADTRLLWRSRAAALGLIRMSATHHESQQLAANSRTQRPSYHTK